jgi:hypothetical protein
MPRRRCDIGIAVRLEGTNVGLQLPVANAGNDREHHLKIFAFAQRLGEDGDRARAGLHQKHSGYHAEIVVGTPEGAYQGLRRAVQTRQRPDEFGAKKIGRGKHPHDLNLPPRRIRA